jgi:hypothetical protein
MKSYPIEGVKHCSWCRDWKHVLNFNINMTKPDGLQDWCRMCQASYQSLTAERPKRGTRVRGVVETRCVARASEPITLTLVIDNGKVFVR